MDKKQQLEMFVRDIKKVHEAEQVLKGLEIMGKIASNTENVINYALSKKIISSLEDVIYVIKQAPEIEDILVKSIYAFKDRGDLVKAEPHVEYRSAPYQYNGTGYNRLQDVPGYGTQWNERCVPDGVNIKNSGYERC